jgi:hypothetical protein
MICCSIRAQPSGRAMAPCSSYQLSGSAIFGLVPSHGGLRGANGRRCEYGMGSGRIGVVDGGRRWVSGTRLTDQTTSKIHPFPTAIPRRLRCSCFDGKVPVGAPVGALLGRLLLSLFAVVLAFHRSAALFISDASTGASAQPPPPPINPLPMLEY